MFTYNKTMATERRSTRISQKDKRWRAYHLVFFRSDENVAVLKKGQVRRPINRDYPITEAQWPGEGYQPILWISDHGKTHLLYILFTSHISAVLLLLVIAFHCQWSLLFNGKPNIGTTASFTAEHEQVIEEMLRHTTNAVAADLRRVIETVTGRKFSLSTVRRHHRRLGWICTKPRYCQAISHINKPLRFQWSKDRYGLDLFKDVIFTDESTIQMDSNSDYVFRKVGEPQPMAARHKHP